MPDPEPRKNGGYLPALAVPVMVVVTLALGIVFLADRYMNHALDKAILSQSEAYALRWAQKIAIRTPELQQVASGELSELSSYDTIFASAETNNIFRFKLFAPDGRLLLVSDESRYLAETAEHDAEALVRDVFTTGVNDVSLQDGRGVENRPESYVEAYVRVSDSAGVPFGVIEVYMDATELSMTFHHVFHRISRWLIVGSALVYLVPSLFFVFRGEKLRARDRDLLHISLYDPLTETLNRREFTKRTKALFAGRQDEAVGVIFLDLDRFKEVNDELGHEFGDQLLRFVATTLKSCLGETDIVGRVGGDEFIVLSPDTDVEHMGALARRVHEALRRTFTYKGSTVTIGVSLGMHLSVPGEVEDWALHAADLALYRAKANGRDQIVRFSPDFDTDLRRRRHVEASMRGALSGNNGFFVEFQPIFQLCCERPTGFEALLRLRDEDGALISPAEFIPIAEESGLVTEIGVMTLECVLNTAKAWPKDLFVAVNLSAVQFKPGDFVDIVADLLDRSGFEAARLNLEVTESLLLEDEENVRHQLDGLKALGATISLDDFGTGYSSLGYLWKFHFDKLKIDRTFLQGFDVNSEKYSQVIETIVMLGHNLEMDVIVEGVESELQLDMLKQLGCDQFQGFLLGRPMSASDALVFANKTPAAKRSA